MDLVDMAEMISPTDVKNWLSDGTEIAFLDVREHGQYGEAHPFFVVPLPYSVFESRLQALVPNPEVRLVLVDAGDGTAERAAATAQALGYGNVHVMRGGAPGWGEAGFTLYAGVNVPSKTFGELLELARHTPRVTAQELTEMQAKGSNTVIVDGRPYAEYNRFSIPGGVCCPNGELVLRIGEIAPDPETTIIVNCAGRTRSILGAQTLIDAGVPNPVYALENGTQGWFLAGLELARGATARYPEASADGPTDGQRSHVRRRAEDAGVTFVSGATVDAMLKDTARTTYLFDVRTREEFDSDGHTAARHAPGGQLVQATDQWVGVRGARLVVYDREMLRAPMVARWLSQLGHEAYVVDGGIAKLAAVAASDRQERPSIATVPTTTASAFDPAAHQIVDLRPSMVFRTGHLDTAHWAIRPRLDRLDLNVDKPVALVGEPDVVGLVASDLTALGHGDIKQLEGGPEDWRAAGLKVVETPDNPADEDCIDFLFFTAERHNGNEAASRQYLEWEVGLVDQLDDQERQSFRIVT